LTSASARSAAGQATHRLEHDQPHGVLDA
jgi:hypothetical protein